MQLLSRELVKAANDRVTEDVPVPEWGEGFGIRIRSLSVKEHREFTKNLTDADRNDDAALCAQIMVAACIDGDGKPLFTLDDVPWLLEKSSAAVKRIGRAIMALNRMNKEAVEETKKNS